MCLSSFITIPRQIQFSVPYIVGMPCNFSVYTVQDKTRRSRQTRKTLKETPSFSCQLHCKTISARRTIPAASSHDSSAEPLNEITSQLCLYSPLGLAEQDSGLCYSSAFFNFSLAQVWNIKWEQVLQCRATWLEYVYVCGQIRDLAIASLSSSSTRSFISYSPRNGVFGYVKDENLQYQSLSKAVGIKDRHPSKSAPFSHPRKK